MTQAQLVSVQVGLPRLHSGADDGRRPWTSGIVKSAVVGPVRLDRLNLDGDGQADLENHGGVDKAVLCYSADHYPDWRRRLAIVDMPYGGFGENLTITGLDETKVCVGDTWRVGDALLQVSQPRQPCWKLGRRWQLKELPAWVIENGRGGWYVRVLQEGQIEAGQALLLEDRPHPAWTVDRLNQIMHHRPDDLVAAAELAQLPLLAESWRQTFAKRLVK